uniref:Retrotransposon gag domain-containing protein n=1 Tax=Chenopodium quinoa TaxID=63459 RepID=A0A803MQZ7_CHEQI
MKKLRGLRQTGSIRDYIGAYSSIMLEIPGMEEKTRLIFFMDDLQRWAEQELRRRGVKTLMEGIIMTESLVEVSSRSRRDRGKTTEESDHEVEEASLQSRVKHDTYGKDKAQSKGDNRNEEGVSHNLVSLREARNLGIKFTKVDGELKVINTESTPVHGRAWKVPIRLGK